MPDEKISQMPAAVSVSDADLLEIVQGGTNKKITRGLLKSTSTADLSDFNTNADARITLKSGAASGICPLDSGSKVPSAYLPAYVDDVLEYANLAGFPVTGTTGIIYVDLATNKTYRWSGSAYVEISPSPGSTDSVTEGSVNLYHTAARVNALIAAALVSPILTTPALGTPTSGNLANCTFPTLNQNTTGSAGSLLNLGTITSIREVATISGTGLATTATINATTQSVYWSNAAATANYAVNLTTTAGMNTSLAVGNSLTVELITNNTGTAYYCTSVQVEGTTSGVTTNWQGGTAPASGNINSKDIYTFQVFKTAASTYTVFASQTKFA